MPTMPLILRRSATVYSMTQLEGEAAEEDALVPSASLVATPDKAVREVEGAALPLYSFPAKDGFASKRIRSFGDLVSAAPLVPDVDEQG